MKDQEELPLISFHVFQENVFEEIMHLRMFTKVFQNLENFCAKIIRFRQTII